MSGESSDPTTIRKVAVSRADVVSALELNHTSDQHAVLRITPPFSGRMRARLHVTQNDEYSDQPQPVHIEPESVVTDETPAFPRPADTEQKLREDPDQTYSVEHHHSYHTEALEEWRSAVTIRKAVTIQKPTELHEVELSVLGNGK